MAEKLGELHCDAFRIIHCLGQEEARLPKRTKGGVWRCKVGSIGGDQCDRLSLDTRSWSKRLNSKSKLKLYEFLIFTRFPQLSRASADSH
jgi:hypothetical protein